MSDEQDMFWEDAEASGAGDVQCKNCGSDTFQLGLNKSGEMRVCCDECGLNVAFCWVEGSGGNTILHLEPSTEGEKGYVQQD